MKSPLEFASKSKKPMCSNDVIKKMINQKLEFIDRTFNAFEISADADLEKMRMKAVKTLTCIELEEKINKESKELHHLKTKPAKLKKNSSSLEIELVKISRKV